MTKVTSFRLKDILPFIEYFGPILILFSFIKLVFYFLYFGINIIGFLEISEILLTFLNYIVVFVLFYAAMGFIIALLRLEMDFKWIIFIICLPAIIIIYFSPIALIIKKISYVLFVFTLLNNLGFKGFSDNYNRIVVGNSMLALVLYIFMLKSIALKQAMHVQLDKTTKGTIIILDKKDTLVSTDSNYYIGKTKDYIFFYHESNKHTDIIPMSRVTSISVINNTSDLKGFYFFPDPIF